ncbi:HPr family phosphocarrier protein [Entomospira nematocerorum]|uniref:HPr family phosphocarrier protein n=1 Tax=Entomospira nematocerorum TaxID=2719987 RepID=A0A968GCQ1_9SPIO|nr:HPr family phosphocarrier protein [Entomospira nematocera]NIZ47435.1 HPr family phosphocarrier protein [Entomospira nematocera]WDI34027.1 HPr family phosphocarrier protein [Entomospira nematocera]
MKSMNVIVKNKEGLHTRPASLIMQCACEFSADVQLIVQDEVVNAKSIMSLIGVSAIQGSEVTIVADGEDEDAALSHLADLFDRGFDED